MGHAPVAATRSRAACLVVLLLLGGCFDFGGLANLYHPDGGGPVDASGEADLSEADLSEAPSADLSIDLMTDARNCGTIGHDCLGGACKAGACQPLELSLGAATSCLTGLAMDSTHLYVADRGGFVAGADGQVLRVEKSLQAMSATTVYPAGSIWSVNSIDLDADSIYFNGQTNKLKRVAKPGGTAVDVATVDPVSQESNYIRQLAVRGGYVYWAAADGIRRTPVDATDALVPEVVVSGGVQPSTLAVDGARVYYGMNNQISVADLSALPTITITPLVSGHNPAAIVFDGTYLYWADLNTNAVYRAVKSDGSGVLMLAPGVEVAPRDLILDGTDLYWTTWGPCWAASCAVEAVQRVSTDPALGPAKLLYKGPGLATGLAVDGTAIYWTNWWFRTVSKLAK